MIIWRCWCWWRWWNNYDDGDIDNHDETMTLMMTMVQWRWRWWYHHHHYHNHHPNCGGLTIGVFYFRHRKTKQFQLPPCIPLKANSDNQNDKDKHTRSSHYDTNRHTKRIARRFFNRTLFHRSRQGLLLLTSQCLHVVLRCALVRRQSRLQDIADVAILEIGNRELEMRRYFFR